ncbi:MAG: hypothetical protein ACI9CA_001440 [Natronomonas sp.]|jgi:hypothetical protein
MSPTTRLSVYHRTVVLLLVVGALVVPAGAMAASPERVASHDGGTDPVFVVSLGEDGSAELVVRYTFDLSTDSRAAAFEELETNETARAGFADRFERRIATVTQDAETVTGREMSVGDSAVDLRTEGEAGVAELRVGVEGLTAVDGAGVTLAEPFASGFEPDREFRVVPPDGYAVESVTPSAGSEVDGELVWAAGTDLSGFEVVASGETEGTATSSSDDSGDTQAETTGGGSSGFGSVAALVALAATLVALRRR